MTLSHRNGGTITRITHVGHQTYKGVADWYFRGDVKWSDGGESDGIPIGPSQLCYDEGNEEGHRLHDALNEYLKRAGEWHDAKHKRDGRVYHWTPHHPKGEESLAREALV